MKKSRIASILLVPAELNVAAANVRSFSDATKVLRDWSYLCPEQGYVKLDVTLTWESGFEFAFRYDLAHSSAKSTNSLGLDLSTKIGFYLSRSRISSNTAAQAALLARPAFSGLIHTMYQIDALCAIGDSLEDEICNISGQQLPFMAILQGRSVIYDHPDGNALPDTWIGICVESRDVTAFWYLGRHEGERSFSKLQAKNYQDAVIEIVGKQST